MRTDKDQDLLHKMEELGVDRVLSLLCFKYGKEPYKQVLEPEKDEEGEEIEPDESMLMDDILYCTQQIGKVDEFVDNYERIDDEFDRNDPFHWKHRKAQMDKLMEGLKNFG